jgi:thiol-disulfide isomerase/thioredoxin
VPDLTLQNYSGEEVDIAKQNKPTVINSWAGWCSFCKKELKDFAQIQDKLKDKIKIIAINRAEEKQKAKGYTDNLGVTNDLIFLLDPKDKFYKQIGGFAMPETVLVNKNGEIVFHKRGPMDAEELKQKINKFLLN